MSAVPTARVHFPRPSPASELVGYFQLSQRDDSVPPGTPRILARLPGVETPGYYQLSLGDKATRPFSNISMAAPVLIVAYGNPLRCDDGIAWRTADALQGKFPASEVEILRLHQLAPEIADSVRQRQLVLFVDAACVDDVEKSRPGEIRVLELSGSGISEQRPGHFSHIYSPAKVLDLAGRLYNATPKAFVITVAGEDFDHGDRLSAPVAKVLPELLATIQRMIEEKLIKAKTTKDTK